MSCSRRRDIEFLLILDENFLLRKDFHNHRRDYRQVFHLNCLADSADRIFELALSIERKHLK